MGNTKTGAQARRQAERREDAEYRQRTHDNLPLGQKLRKQAPFRGREYDRLLAEQERAIQAAKR